MIRLIDELTPQQLSIWPRVNREIIWGWKRDVGEQKRLVYFSGSLTLHGNSVVLDRYHFYLSSVVSERFEQIENDLRDAHSAFAALSDSEFAVKQKGRLRSFYLHIGTPTASDLDRTRRLKLRRPRKRIQLPQFPMPQTLVPNPSLFPADLYVGSGLSYEAGLPTLCDMHDAFAVDCHESSNFMVGAKDWLPRALAEEGIERLKKFCMVHTQAILADPTFAMRTIARLQREGKIRTIFTDNVDNLLSKVDVPFERVRGSGVFNERYDADFASDTLIVIGVAADRRQIISQARRKGMKIVVVNPCNKVSPNVTHLDYLKKHDLFYKTEAERFFATVTVSETTAGRL